MEPILHLIIGSFNCRTSLKLIKITSLITEPKWLIFFGRIDEDAQTHLYLQYTADSVDPFVSKKNNQLPVFHL